MRHVLRACVALLVVGCGAASNHARPWQVNLEAEAVSNDVLVGPCL
jgi:hypothetical protein